VRPPPVQVCEKADVLFVATKPQYVRLVLSENKAALKGKLIVSIAAGVTCATLLEALGSADAKVIRVMPNTPCLVGATAAAMCAGARPLPANLCGRAASCSVALRCKEPCVSVSAL
jgi:pyrroline-5-carboxylate reductase